MYALWKHIFHRLRICILLVMECRRDSKKVFTRIIGRVDDVINVSGHRLGTAEIESALR